MGPPVPQAVLLTIPAFLARLREVDVDTVFLLTGGRFSDALQAPERD